MSSERGDTTCEDLMIQVKNAWKSYSGSQYILKDLSISVPKGRIYSLLGSSGVGKTTLLNCIIGNMVLDSGYIDVNLDSRLQIGYMPQELALYTDMSLKEVFKFFGLIFDMTNNEILIRTKELTQILQLPHPNILISTLSGGQQRRVSVAVAMLKDPDLLILDEPTANLDPLLKHSIWSYLKTMSREKNKTILLTTHYIEEARNSDKVGFLTGGCVLMEGTPEEALEYTQPRSERLEDVYYHICSRQTQRQQEMPEPPKIDKSMPKLFQQRPNFSFQRVFALILKSFFYIRRNSLIFYVFILSPIMMVMFLSLSLNRPHGLKLGYVNYEDECSRLNVNCSTPLSCRYLRNLKEKDFKLVQFNSVDEGKEAVKRNIIWGVVRFNWNFSDGVVNRLDYFYASEHVEIGEDDEAKVWLDMSASPIGFMIKKHFYDMFLKSIEDWYTDCGWNTRAAHPILREKEPIFGEIDESLISSVIPTNIIIMILSTSIALGLIFVLSDRELGTFDRCRLPGIKMAEVIVAGYIVCFASLIGTGIALIAFMHFYSGPYNAPFGWFILIMCLQLTLGVLLGSMIGIITTNLATALQVTVGIIAPMTYISGCLWPNVLAHWFVKILYNLSPGFIPGGALRVMAVKGLVLNELIWAIGHSVIWILLTIAALLQIIKRRENL